MQMPVMDGPSATVEIRKTSSCDTLPILALTANAQAEDKRRCMESGMNDFMAKPVDASELVDKILALTHDMKRNLVPEDTTSQPNSETAKATSQMNPTTPGIDLPKVMTRLGNNKILLAKLLRMFIDQHGNDIALINNSLASEDREKTIHLAHALKGTAGNLSAENLQKMAAQLETYCRLSEVLPEKVSVELEAAMTEALASMHLLLETNEEKKDSLLQEIPQWNKEQVSQKLTLLQSLICENDISAEDEFTKYRSGLEFHASGEKLESIANALLVFDFESAHDSITALLDELTTTEV